MDQRERIADQEELIRAALDNHEAHLWTAIPAIVQSYDPQENTVYVQPTVDVQVRDQQGVWNWTEFAVLIHCPVVFPGGGPLVLTFPIAKDDEVLLVIASRCIDAWWQNGGVQVQAQLRMHDLQDGFAIPVAFSKPRVPQSINTDNAQLRTLDGSCYIEVQPGGVVHIVAPNGMIVDGDVTVNGDLQVNGEIAATGEITAKNSHTVSAHVHGGVQSGGSNTQTPTG